MFKSSLLEICVASIIALTWIETNAFGQPASSDAATVDVSKASPAKKDLQKLDGIWLFVEDRTKGRAVDMGGPPMSARFRLRVEEDAVVYPRPRSDERITLDGSILEKSDGRGSIQRYSGVWKEGALEYTIESVRASDNKKVLVIRRVFQATNEGLLVQISQNEGPIQEALYRHPDDIALPDPVKATINDMAWLATAWIGLKNTSSIEERWSPPKGGAMLAVSRTVRENRMVAFEYLRIVERGGGLVYIAQPAGREPTEFILVDMDEKQATFVNPRHDYPQRIVYEHSKEGTLTTSIGFAKGRLQSLELQKESN